jgi:hypothetical protein
MGYMLGGLQVESVTENQVKRWNQGDVSDNDMKAITVIWPTTNHGLPTFEIVSLWDLERRLPIGSDVFSQMIEDVD